MKNPVTFDATVIERWHVIEQCAADLIAAIDRNLARDPWPIKYRVPWKEALALSEALRKMPQAYSPLGRIPPGPTKREEP